MDNELNAALKGIWDSLTDEQKAQAKACQSMEELTMLAGKLGFELPDETLAAVAGGLRGPDDPSGDHSGGSSGSSSGC